MANTTRRMSEYFMMSWACNRSKLWFGMDMLGFYSIGLWVKVHLQTFHSPTEKQPTNNLSPCNAWFTFGTTYNAVAWWNLLFLVIIAAWWEINLYFDIQWTDIKHVIVSGRSQEKDRVGWNDVRTPYTICIIKYDAQQNDRGLISVSKIIDLHSTT